MIKVSIHFQDKNQPAINQDCKSEKEAQRVGVSLLRQYAGVKNLTVTFESGEKAIYDAMGHYLFTVPKL